MYLFKYMIIYCISANNWTIQPLNLSIKIYQGVIQSKIEVGQQYSMQRGITSCNRATSPLWKWHFFLLPPIGQPSPENENFPASS